MNVNVEGCLVEEVEWLEKRKKEGYIAVGEKKLSAKAEANAPRLCNDVTTASSLPYVANTRIGSILHMLRRKERAASV